MYIYSLEGVNVIYVNMHLVRWPQCELHRERCSLHYAVFMCQDGTVQLHPARCKLHRFIFEASKFYVVLCMLWGGFALFVMSFFVVCASLFVVFCSLYDVFHCSFITCLYGLCGLLLVCWIAFGCGPCCGRGLPRSFYPDLLYCI